MSPSDSMERKEKPMRITKRTAQASAVLAATALALSACGGGTTSNGGGAAAGSGGAASGAITVGAAYETTDYGPITTSALAMGVNWSVLEGLYEFDMSDYSTRAALAAGDPTKVSDTEYEITLRDGAKFSDGKDVTSKDVVSSYKRATADKSIYKQFFGFVDSVAEKDPKTVTVKLKYPFENLKARFVSVKVVPDGSDEEALKAKPVGTGPYMYDSVTPTEVKLVPNPNYNGDKKATVAELKYQALKDDSARLSAAVGGTIDAMEAVPASAKAQLEGAGWKVEAVPGYGNPFLMFNTTKAPFDKAEVRQALHYAINTQKLVDTAMDGQAKPATSFLPEANPAYKKAKVQFDYDVNKAKELLAKNGVKDLSITLTTTDHPWVTNLIPQIKQDLEAAGVKVAVKSMASADVYANVADVDNPTYDVILAPGDPSVFGTDPGIIIEWWNADNVWTQKRSHWKESDPASWGKLQELIKAANQATGDDAKAKWGEAQDLLSEQAVTYPLFHRNMLTAWNEGKITGFKPIASTGLQTIGVGLK